MWRPAWPGLVMRQPGGHALAPDEGVGLDFAAAGETYEFVFRDRASLLASLDVVPVHNAFGADNFLTFAWQAAWFHGWKGWVKAGKNAKENFRPRQRSSRHSYVLQIARKAKRPIAAPPHLDINHRFPNTA